MNVSEYIKQYLSNNNTSNTVLYRKNKNPLITAYNYIFHNYGILKIIKHDTFWIFHVYKRDICVLSYIFSHSFIGVDIMYRSVRIKDGMLHKTDMSELRTARNPNDKELLCEHLVHLLDGTY